MPTREGPISAARSRGLRINRMVGQELRNARRMAGVSQRLVGGAIGLSAAEVGRIERGAAPWLTVVHASELLGVVGLDLSARAYPAGKGLRDEAHLRLLNRFEAHLHPSIVRRREWPIPLEGDRRAIDLVLFAGEQRIGVEAETTLTDLQALERSLNLKQRDGRLDRILLLVAGTRGNRAIVRDSPALRTSFPSGTRSVLARLRSGAAPAQNGIVLL